MKLKGTQWFFCKREGSCITDANGPEMFKKCAHAWVDPKDFSKDTTGKYKRPFPTKGRCTRSDPPSKNNFLCEKFHKKIKKLR